VRTQSFLVMIPESDEEKESRQKRDDDNSDCRSREKFEMKMFRTKKPSGGSAKNASTYLWG
jgi:hypothetical protein